MYMMYLDSYIFVLLADRAKQIKTSAKVNEDPTEKLIRELQEENEKLKEMLQSGNIQRIQTDGDDDMTEAGTIEILALIKIVMAQVYRLGSS